MRKFDRYKTIIFPSEQSKRDLIYAMQTYKYDVTTFDDAYAHLFFKAESEHLQFILAPFLRALAIQQLREGLTPRTSEINENYAILWDSSSGHAQDIDTFLGVQSSDKVYGTDYEAIALAEVLDVSFACTLVHPTTYKPLQSTAIYHETQTEAASRVHLYNTPGIHFFVIEKDPNSTEGNGNCLYNSFALFLCQFVLDECGKEIKVYADQQKILNKINGLKPVTLAELFARTQKNISLGDEIDHIAAVNLAAEHLSSRNHDINKEKSELPSASLFLQIMTHPAVKVMGLVLLVAGLLILGIGLACFFPVSAAFTGIALSYSVATTLSIVGGGSAFAGSMISFFHQPSDKSQNTTETKVLQPVIA